ncbi:trypsin-like peptidase domain-containing protein [Sediminispirochaeta smaragdinae]|uniref:Peptidase domain protein n=1 Tax=Sediminispirochaeta smaragdinae (strain DSM 11293 / JCM 15392 / SEBR 4228) TaxID=573413 RepID=E1RCC8_SEDSS|nr:trypsin-like peptidase domain-containing protein [Sediminispirochaeta smaragdinae]ADK80008.1 peptidase domain protein [Sediminispirochaeta smaragdinae DSM 11293]
MQLVPFRFIGRFHTTLLFFSLVLSFLLPASQAVALEKERSYRLLTPGRVSSETLDVSDDAPGYLTYRFTVPEGVFGVEVQLFDSAADLDLFVQYGSEIRSYDQVDFYSMSDNYNETIFFSRLTDPTLKSGVYYLDVAYQRNSKPRIDGERSDKIPFSLSLRFIDGKAISALSAGTPREATLQPEEGMSRRFFIDVPKDAGALRLDITDAEADIDLLVSRDNPVANREEADYVKESFLGRESLVITGKSDPPLEPGRYYITAFDQVSSDHPERFTILSTFDRSVPEQLKEIDPLPLPSDESEIVLLSTVEVIGTAGKGSGCLVSKDGLILTNWHVVENYDGKVSPSIYIAVNLDNSIPPKELFQAELVESDPDADLALLRVDKGLNGELLPSGYGFPYITIGDSASLRIGQPLSFFGYPGIGGTGSRASISVTRGIVSGFEAVGDRLFIKTDAEINSGNSGGAAVDVYYQLIGIPTVIIGEEGGQIAYVTPVSAVPEAWLKTINLHNL